MKKYFLTCMVAFCTFLLAHAQKTISGVVNDSDGLPLPGASIVEKGTSNGVTSDFDGNYSIEASEGSVLVFSFVGYASQEITVGSEDTISVSLESGTELEEVVLTALGLEKKKDDDLTSTTKIEVDGVQRSGETGVLQGMSGKTSGVNITRNSGDPGSGAYIQIRGQNTIFGDISPLIILDGAIISNDNFGGGVAGVVQQSRLNDINPDDIESISVIKGAAAAAIYGTGAANGVLVINTKRGSDSPKGWSVNAKSTLSVETINAEWNKQGSWGQGFPGQWVGEAPGTGVFVENTGFSFGDQMSLRPGGADTYDFSGGWFETQDGRRIGNIAQKNDKTNYNQVNRDAVFGNGYTYDNSVSFSYNGEKNRTYISISNVNQDGIMKGNSDYERTSLKLNNTTQATDKLLFKLSSSYTNITSNRVQTGSNLSGLYLGYLRNSPDFDFREYKGTNYRIVDGVTTVTPNSHRSYRRNTGSYRTFNTATGAFNYLAPSYNNPLWTMREQKNLNDVNRFIFSPEVNYNFNDNLNLAVRYSVDYYQDNRLDYRPPGSASEGNNGQYTEDRYSNKLSQLNMFLTGGLDLTSNVGLNYTVGYQQFESDYRRLSAFEAVFTNPDQEFLNPGNAASQNSLPSGFRELRRQNGVYGVLNFDIGENLLVELTGRGETFSTMPNAGIIFYPSASVGYKLTDIVNLDALSFLKVRASYGEVGVAPPAYITSTVLGPGGIGSSWGDGLDGSVYGNPFTQSTTRGNPDLKEERKKEFEIGFDSRFFDNNLTLGFTYYDNKTEDGILALPITPSSGFNTTFQNATLITNKGIEIDLSANLINTEDLSFDINGSFTQNKNIVESLEGAAYFGLNGFTGTESGIAEGEPYGIQRHGQFLKDASGNLLLGSNGFPQADPELLIAGDPNPDFRAGLGTSLRYKNFNFTTQFETSQGNDVWNGTYSVMLFWGIHESTDILTINDTGSTIFNAWGDPIPAGAQFRGYIEDFGAGPVAVDHEWWTANGGGFGDVTSQFVEDASWVKLREISLSYDFDKSLIERLGLDNLSLSLSGRNLFTWSNIKEFDPENNLTGASRGRGLEYFSNPGTRSILTTLRFGF